jgi:hypothetical protein
MAEIGPKHVRNTCETVSTKGKQAQARAWAAIIGFRTAMAASSLQFELNASFPDRCMPFRTAMAAFSLHFDYYFRTVTCFSGPQ